MTTTPRTPGFLVDDPPPWRKQPAPNHRALIDNHEFLADCSRYLEGIYTRAQVKRRWRNIDDATWDLLGDDNELVDAIELERTRRIRSGQAKNEKAQLLVIHGPQILSDIATSPKASDKHRIDAVRALDSLTGNPAEAEQQDRIVIRIDLSADTRARGDAPNPADVLIFEATPNPNNTIDSTAQESPQQEMIPPPRRGPGRPPGSGNRPKEPLPITDDSDGE